MRTKVDGKTKDILHQALEFTDKIQALKVDIPDVSPQDVCEALGVTLKQLSSAITMLTTLQPVVGVGDAFSFGLMMGIAYAAKMGRVDA